MCDFLKKFYIFLGVMLLTLGFFDNFQCELFHLSSYIVYCSQTNYGRFNYDGTFRFPFRSIMK